LGNSGVPAGGRKTGRTTRCPSLTSGQGNAATFPRRASTGRQIAAAGFDSTFGKAAAGNPSFARNSAGYSRQRETGSPGSATSSSQAARAGNASASTQAGGTANPAH